MRLWREALGSFARKGAKRLWDRGDEKRDAFLRVQQDRRRHSRHAIVRHGADRRVRGEFTPTKPAIMGYDLPEAAPESAAGGKPEPEVPLPELLAKADPKEGQKKAQICTTCHSFGKGEASKPTGPNLGAWWGASTPPTRTSPILTPTRRWAPRTTTGPMRNIFNFIKGPRADMPGTKMTFAGMPSPTDRAAVLVYLRTLSDNPVPLPKVEAKAAPAAPPAGQPAAQPTGSPPANPRSSRPPPHRSHRRRPSPVPRRLRRRQCRKHRRLQRPPPSPPHQLRRPPRRLPPKRLRLPRQLPRPRRLHKRHRLLALRRRPRRPPRRRNLLPRRSPPRPIRLPNSLRSEQPVPVASAQGHLAIGGPHSAR